MRFFSGRSRGKSRSCGPGGGRRHAPGCLRCVGGGPVEKWWCRYTQPTVARRVACRYRDVQPNVAEKETTMEYGSIEREIHVDASPEVVFEVVSSPEHLREWWPDEADVRAGRPAPAGEHRLRRDRARRGARSSRITVVDAEPPRLFSFRWAHDGGRGRRGRQLAAGHLRPDAVGRGHPAADDRDRLPRDGLGGRRPRGSSTASTSTGWDYFLPRLGAYVARLVVGVMTRRPSTTTSGRRSATRPGAGCSTCCWPTAAAPRPR